MVGCLVFLKSIVVLALVLELFKRAVSETCRFLALDTSMLSFAAFASIFRGRPLERFGGHSDFMEAHPSSRLFSAVMLDVLPTRCRLEFTVLSLGEVAIGCLLGRSTTLFGVRTV